MRYLLVLLGGGAGSLLRYLVATAMMERFPSSRMPWGTIACNLTGAFLIGFLVTFCAERYPGNETWRPLLIVGLLGGYTTFSSLEYETFAAVRGGAFWIGMANVIGSMAAGYIAVWLGAVAAARK